MSGLLRRLTRRRPATADENPSPTAGSAEPAAAPADAPAETGGQSPVAGSGEPATTAWGAAAGPAASGEPQGPAADPSATGSDPAADDQPTQILPQTGEQAAQPTSPGAEWVKTPAPAEPAAEQPTAFAAQPAPSRDLPAGVDAGDLSTAPPASARRGKLRRRLRYLRHVRELLLRDLGGFTYEIHRTAGGTAQEGHRKLEAAKANRIAALDAEVGAIEARLGEPHAGTVLREAGIGGTCPECGELHASDAHFCSRCGAALDPKARAQRHAAVVAAARPMIATPEAPEAQPASVLWAGGPRPAGSTREDESRTAPATSEWLAARDQPTTFDRAAQPAASDESSPGGDEPTAAAGDEPTATADDEPTATADDEPTAATDDEPTAATDDEPTAATRDEPAAAPSDEPPTAAGDDAAAPSDPAAAADELSQGGDEPAASDEPAAATGDETASDEPSGAATPAKPKRRPSRATKPAPEKPSEESGQFEPGPNGRRDEDVPPPVTSGDPLAIRREQGS